MKFKTEILIEVLDLDEGESFNFGTDEKPFNVTKIKDKYSTSSRWEKHYILVFEYDGHFYQTYYSRGATEMQETYPFENDGEELDCKEVFKKEKVIYVYE